MAILMGGSGSTGSSMLRTVIDRHSMIFSGGELNFFNKEQFFLNWSKAKLKLLDETQSRRIKTNGWFPYPGQYLLHDDYLWKEDELEELIQKSDTFDVFSKKYFAKPLKANNKSLWLEKTPSNAYNFTNFLNLFTDGKVIQTTRNPLDTIASLVKRGMSPFFATGLWTYNNATALTAKNDSRYFLVQYESLVENPTVVIKDLFDFIGVPFEEETLSPRDVNGKTMEKIDSWSNKRTGSISNKSVGSFYKLPEGKQEEIIIALNRFQISRRHVIRNKLEYTNAHDLCEYFGYEFPKVKKNSKRLIVDYSKDILRRTVKLYPTNIFNYPARLK